MATLHLSGSDGGLDVPNLRLYQLAAHLCVMADWLKCDPTLIWLDIEASQPRCLLWNLLFVNNPESPWDICSNPITSCTVKAWRSIQALEGTAHLTSSLTPILDNPDFLPGSKLGDLFTGQTLLSFQQLQQWYSLQKGELFRYLKIRHFITKDTTLTTNIGISHVERALSLQVSKKRSSVFYKALNSNSPLTSQATKQAWKRDLGVSIDDADWQEIWIKSIEISLCNRTKSTHFTCS